MWKKEKAKQSYVKVRNNRREQRGGGKERRKERKKLSKQLKKWKNGGKQIHCIVKFFKIKKVG